MATDQQTGTNTLWMGDLEPYMDENYIYQLMSQTGPLTSVKVIRDRGTGMSQGFGFIEFPSHEAAQRVLEQLSGKDIPGTGKQFRLNWSSFGQKNDNAPEHSIFVGDIGDEVTDYQLQSTFAARYPSVRSAKVVRDGQTGKCKGYGFVRFSDENEGLLAIKEMNHFILEGRPLRVSSATPRNRQQDSYGGGGGRDNFDVDAEENATNTVVFVGGIDDPTLSEEDIRRSFSQFGMITYSKIPPGKGCAFVQFATHEQAVAAIKTMRGQRLGNSVVRPAWGHSGARTDPAAVQAQQAMSTNPYAQQHYGQYQQYGQYQGQYGQQAYGNQQAQYAEYYRQYYSQQQQAAANYASISKQTPSMDSSSAAVSNSTVGAESKEEPAVNEIERANLEYINNVAGITVLATEHSLIGQ